MRIVGSAVAGSQLEQGYESLGLNVVGSPGTLVPGLFDGEPVATGDISNTGLPDVAVVAASSSDVATLLNLGNTGSTWLGLGTAHLFATGYGAADGNPVLADFNADGDLDLAFLANSSQDLEILPGAGDGSFTAAQVYVGLTAYAGGSLAAAFVHWQ